MHGTWSPPQMTFFVCVGLKKRESTWSLLKNSCRAIVVAWGGVGGCNKSNIGLLRDTRTSMTIKPATTIVGFYYPKSTFLSLSDRFCNPSASIPPTISPLPPSLPTSTLFLPSLTGKRFFQIVRHVTKDEGRASGTIVMSGTEELCQ